MWVVGASPRPIEPALVFTADIDGDQQSEPKRLKGRCGEEGSGDNHACDGDDESGAPRLHNGAERGVDRTASVQRKRRKQVKQEEAHIDQEGQPPEIARNTSRRTGEIRFRNPKAHRDP